MPPSMTSSSISVSIISLVTEGMRESFSRGIAHDAKHIAEINELRGLQRAGDRARGDIGIDVQAHAILVLRDGRNNGRLFLGQRFLHLFRFNPTASPTKPRSTAPPFPSTCGGNFSALMTFLPEMPTALPPNSFSVNPLPALTPTDSARSVAFHQPARSQDEYGETKRS